MSHLPLDARAILHYLNELGYRNISATQLKEFLKDLRKLIKYEDRMGVNIQQNDYFESLFRRTTASYRAKIDRENAIKGQKRSKSDDLDKPTTSKRAAAQSQRVINERNQSETDSSLDSAQPQSRQPRGRAVKHDVQRGTGKESIKSLIEETLTQVLREKYSQNSAQERENKSDSKEKTSIKSIVEEILKEKLSGLQQPLDHSTKKIKNSDDAGSLKSMIEEIAAQVLQEKMFNLQKNFVERQDCVENVRNLNQELQQKLNISKEQAEVLQREPLVQYNTNKTLDSQALVQQLLAVQDINKKGKSKNSAGSKSDKENANTSPIAGCIKRRPRSPRKHPEWQDPSRHDSVMNKPCAASNIRTLRSRSPTQSLSAHSARSGRSKCSSSVLIRRPVSQGRNNKPNSDPVALYQYYKNEWEHFRQQIPGESPHNRLRWHVRQRLLDPE